MGHSRTGHAGHGSAEWLDWVTGHTMWTIVSSDSYASSQKSRAVNMPYWLGCDPLNLVSYYHFLCASTSLQFSGNVHASDKFALSVYRVLAEFIFRLKKIHTFSIRINKKKLIVNMNGRYSRCISNIPDRLMDKKKDNTKCQITP